MVKPWRAGRAMVRPQMTMRMKKTIWKKFRYRVTSIAMLRKGRESQKGNDPPCDKLEGDGT